MGDLSAAASREGTRNNYSVKLSDLINMKIPIVVLNEVKAIISKVVPELNSKPIDKAFKDIVDLFSGRYPGYQACNTEYHDLNHTMDTFLAMARLLHGAWAKGVALNSETVALGLISALMHDTGYIQQITDRTGTGAKYSLVHIERSAEFMEKYFRRKGYPQNSFCKFKNALRCTGLDTNTNAIGFASKENEIMSKMLGTADLLGQMADRTYLEKLLFLFVEFKEGNVPGFESELDLLRKTLQFHQVAKKRLATEMSGMDSFMRVHFEIRWGVKEDLYDNAIEGQMRYLKSILETHGAEYRDFLRRDGIAKKLAHVERNN
jgi:hypothetical protein